MDSTRFKLLKLQVRAMKAYVDYRIALKQRKKRSMGVRPMYQKRRQLGDGHNLLEEMRLSDTEMLFNYTRLNTERFEYLLRLVGPFLKKRQMCTVITESQRLAMTLRFLAGGDSQDTLAWAYRCGQSTVSGILTETLSVIVNVLQPLVLVPPSTPQEWEEIAEEFWSQWNFPNCAGAIDGKHIQIQAPQASGSLYFNYKKIFSQVLLAVCDAEYRFLLVDVGAEGPQSDGGIFSQSEIGRRLEEKSLGFPGACSLPGTNIKLPYAMVGDAAFQLKSYMMKPYGGNGLNLEESIFNYRLSRARRVIENAFGILAARWRIFRRPICALEETVKSIVLGAITLHNFILQTGECSVKDAYCPSTFVDSEQDGGECIDGEWRQVVAQDGGGGALRELGQAGSHNHARQAKRHRDTLRDYVNGVGAVPWQERVVRIRRGEMQHLPNEYDDTNEKLI